MDFIETKLNGVFLIKLNPLIDERGSFMRTFDEKIFSEFGIPQKWVQENHSKNLLKNTIRGLHFILPPQTDGKLIRCVRGRIWDVFIDLRKNSPTQGNWEAIELSEKEFNWLFIPKGFAHGFCTLEDNSEILYKHDTYYQKEYDSGILWNDSALKIKWPVENPIISEKDSRLMSYHEFLQNVGGL
jgi:dTDP-4-dehydrorhamnose 3,5-epimerase